MRQLYTFMFTLALPAVLLRLYWRGIKAPEYRRRWQERLGCYQHNPVPGVIWFHAVSVGEAEAAFPLIKRLQSLHPQARMLVTCTTPTGSARIRAVLGEQVEHVYLPYDLPWVLERFMRQFEPRLAVFLEKEVWPNLFAACAEQQIPLYVVNARLSARSATAYRKIPSLIRPALASATLIATQTEDDRLRFIEIGADAERVQVLGNIKFDVTVEDEILMAGRQLKQSLFAGRLVWIAASTHDNEEAQLLAVYQGLKQQIPQLLLVIAPRHPERFQLVAKLCTELGAVVVTRSSGQTVDELTDVYLADSIGELKMLYAAADLAFVGGSLVAVGGHNVLEPAAVGMPILFGMQMFNFQDIAERMLAAQAAVQCHDAQAVGAAILGLHQSAEYKNRLAENAKSFVKQNQGATARIAQLLQ